MGFVDGLIGECSRAASEFAMVIRPGTKCNGM
jgi:hypothetical protein